jgi:hypothetical protein
MGREESQTGGSWFVCDSFSIGSLIDRAVNMSVHEAYQVNKSSLSLGRLDSLDSLNY